MPGTYNGGSTLIGPGVPWPVEPTYDPPHPPSLLTQKELLAALGISKTAMKSKKRGDLLKALRATGMLLETGQPNPDHPTVIAIIADK